MRLTSAQIEWILLTWIENWRVAETAVINASPLIFLSRGHCLNVLQMVADIVLVPESVAAEIRAARMFV